MAPVDVAKELGVSIAASNFSINLLTGGAFDKAYSILPPFVGGKQPRVRLQSKLFHIEYSIFRRLPKSLSFVAPLIEQISIFLRIPRRAHVWFYNITTLNYYLIRCLKLFKPSVKLYVIVLDFTPGQKNGLKVMNMINDADGRISLSNYGGISKANLLLPKNGVIRLNYRQPQVWHHPALKDCHLARFI
jgi:hypothetical protein